MTRDTSDHYVIFSNAQISITYSTTVPPNAPTLDSVSTSGGNLALSWTDASNFNNSTQPAISNHYIYRGNTFYANSSLAEFGSNSESQTGGVDMGTLGNTLLLSFNRTGTQNGYTSFFEGHESGGGRTNATVTQLSITTKDFSDDYTTNSGWIQTGTLVTVDSGLADKVYSNSAPANAVHKVYKSLGFTLDNTLWTAQFEHKFISASSGHAIPFIFTAGTGTVESVTKMH